MRVAFAFDAEAFDGGDDSAAEILGPEAVDDDPRRQWVVRTHEPLREREPIARRCGTEHGGRAGLNALAWIEKVTALEYETRPGLRHFFHDQGTLQMPRRLLLAGLSVVI